MSEPVPNENPCASSRSRHADTHSACSTPKPGPEAFPHGHFVNPIFENPRACRAIERLVCHTFGSNKALLEYTISEHSSAFVSSAFEVRWKLLMRQTSSCICSRASSQSSREDLLNPMSLLHWSLMASATSMVESRIVQAIERFCHRRPSRWPSSKSMS